MPRHGRSIPRGSDPDLIRKGIRQSLGVEPRSAWIIGQPVQRGKAPARRILCQQIGPLQFPAGQDGHDPAAVPDLWIVTGDSLVGDV